MVKQVLAILLTGVLISLAGCQGSSKATPAPRSTQELKQALSSGKKTIVFFLNPAGGPCGAQNEILQKLHQDRGGNFQIAYVSTMKPEDQQAFYDYGVRSLPTVVLVDGSGSISHNFPPGIQSYEALAQALDSVK